MLKVRDYNHVGIVVKDLEACRHFYGAVLGLEGMERPAFDFPGHWYRVGPGLQLHLMVRDEDLSPTMRHFALEVEDFQLALAHLEAHGVPVVDGPGRRADGSDYLFCRDPDGNLIELTRH